MSSGAPQTDEGPSEGRGVLLGGRYRVGKPLGAGAMGVVYAAVDERLGRDVALKVVRSNHLKDAATMARFEREAALAGKLGHPNIVGVTDLGRTDEGFPYVVMERLDGMTLEQRIEKAGMLPVEEAVAIHLQLLDALGCAHQAGVLHRDVKPANTFLSSLATGTALVKLLDFGIAAPAAGGRKLTVDGSVIGSPVYLSPERFRGEPARVESDLYAVGVSLFEALTGSPPFEGRPDKPIHERVLFEMPRALDAIRADVSPQLARVVARALEKKPDDRFHSAAEMREALVQAGTVRPSEPRPAGPVPTFVGATDPSAPSRREPSRPVVIEPKTIPMIGPPASLATERLPRRTGMSVGQRALIGLAVIVVLLSIGVGAFAGMRHAMGASVAPSPGSPAAPTTPVVTSPSTSPPATPPPATPAAPPPTPSLPVGVDPPAAPEPPVAVPPTSPAVTPRARPPHGHHPPESGSSHAPPAEVAPPPEPPPAEPPPRARMGADGLLHPNW